jgi:hypothetical protein
LSQYAGQRTLMHMARGHQHKRFDARLTFNVTGEVRAELEAAAKQAGEPMSDVARGVLVAWATARVVDRGGPAMPGIAAGNGRDHPQTKTEQRL